MNMKSNRPLIIVVVAAAIIVAAVGYLARELASRPDEARVVALIDRHLNAQKNEANPAVQHGALTEKEVIALIDERLGQRKEGPELSEKEFNARVERGIVAFIEKQRREAQDRPNQLARNVPPPGTDDHVYGNTAAPVSLIEYSDFECPYCKRFHDTAKQLVDRSGGKINLVYRHFPLSFHNPGAEKEAEASECVAELGGNKAFWKFTDAVYARTRSNGKGFPVENLAPLAVELGLKQEAFRQCLDSGRMAARVQHDVETGTKAGVEGTPGNILRNNRTGQVQAAHGAQPYERLSEIAQKLLKAR
ncbi:MAG: DsbA family protein [Sulfuricaulis sp.]